MNDTITELRREIDELTEAAATAAAAADKKDTESSLLTQRISEENSSLTQRISDLTTSAQQLEEQLVRKQY